MRMILSCFCLVLSLLVALPVQARDFVPAGHCAIVLSSRPTLEAARADVAARWQGRDVTIYAAQNGWYAITGRVIA